MEKEREGFLKRIKMLEGQLAGLNGKLTNDRNLWFEERSSLMQQIEMMNLK